VAVGCPNGALCSYKPSQFSLTSQTLTDIAVRLGEDFQNEDSLQNNEEGVKQVVHEILEVVDSLCELLSAKLSGDLCVHTEVPDQIRHGP
jgi:hypothetical protein